MAGATAAVPASGLVSGSRLELVGPTYDTLTHKPGSDASAAIETDGQGAVAGGDLRVGGYEIPFDALDAGDDSGRGERYIATLDEPEYRESGSPLKVDVVDGENSVSGFVTRPAPEFGKLGFLLPKDTSVGPERLRRGLDRDNRWTRSEIPFETPGTGVPTDSGLERLTTVLPGREVGRYE